MSKDHKYGNIDFYISSGYIVSVLLYAFFYRALWLNFNRDSTVFGFNAVFIGVLSLGLLIYNESNKNRLPLLTVQDCFLLLFLGLIFGSYFYAINPPLALKGATFWASMFLVYYNFKLILSKYFDDIKSLISITLGVAGIGLVLSYLYSNFNLLSSIADLNESYSETIKSTKSLIGFKNATASFIFMIWALLFSFTGDSKLEGKLQFVFSIISLPLILILLSRNVYLALMVYGILYAFFLHKEKVKRSTIIYVLGGVFLLLFLSVSFQSFISDLGENTLNVRFKLWAHSFRYFADHPVFGIGNYQWDIINSKFTSLAHPHNDFVRILLELGLVGFLIYTIVHLTLIGKGFMLLRQDRVKHLTPFLLLIALVSFLSLGIFESIHYRISHGILLMLLLAILDILFIEKGAIYKIENKLQKGRVVFNGFVILLASFLLFYQYHIFQNDRVYKAFIDKVDQKEIVGAEKELSKINYNIFVDNRKSPAHFKMGVLYQKEKNIANAKQSYEKVLIQFPLNLKTAKALHKISRLEQDKNSEDYYFKLLKKINKYAVKKEILKNKK